MNCEQLVTYLSDYIDNNLDEELTAQAHEHLATCQNCHIVLDTTRRTISLYREQGQAPMPPVRRDRLFETLQAAFANRSQK
jgi:predicted anti-sigma-YlaC factor YlaD